MSKSMRLTSRMGEGPSCCSYRSLSGEPGPGLQVGGRQIHGGPVLRQGPAPLCCGPGQQTRSRVSSRVQGSSCEALVEAPLLGKWRPRLALVLWGRSGSWGGLEEVLGQLGAEERHLGEAVPCGGRG